MTSRNRPALEGAMLQHRQAARHEGAPRRSAVSVGDPILISKITAQGVPDWVVPRPRITELIAQGTRWCPLTIATGPAGAGKTMALALWAAAEPAPVAWVSLDEYDNEPEVFWSYVVAALRRSGVAVPALPAASRSKNRWPASRAAAGNAGTATPDRRSAATT